MQSAIEKEEKVRAYQTLTSSTGWVAQNNDGIWNKSGFMKTPSTSYAQQFQDPWKMLHE